MNSQNQIDKNAQAVANESNALNKAMLKWQKIGVLIALVAVIVTVIIWQFQKSETPFHSSVTHVPTKVDVDVPVKVDVDVHLHSDVSADVPADVPDQEFNQTADKIENNFYYGEKNSTEETVDDIVDSYPNSKDKELEKKVESPLKSKKEPSKKLSSKTFTLLTPCKGSVVQKSDSYKIIRSSKESNAIMIESNEPKINFSCFCDNVLYNAEFDYENAAFIAENYFETI